MLSRVLDKGDKNHEKWELALQMSRQKENAFFFNAGYIALHRVSQ